MKVLSFDVLYFKLPDDFEGGFSDALRALADYHDKVTDTPKQSIGEPQEAPSDKTVAEYVDKIWDDFWNMVHQSDRRVCGLAGVTDYPDGGKGAPLNLNTGIPDGKNTT